MSYILLYHNNIYYRYIIRVIERINMKISNPITPRSTELSQSITITRNEIARLREFRNNSSPELWPALNISIDWALNRLSNYQKELEELK